MLTCSWPNRQVLRPLLVTLFHHHKVYTPNDSKLLSLCNIIIVPVKFVQIHSQQFLFFAGLGASGSSLPAATSPANAEADPCESESVFLYNTRTSLAQIITQCEHY